MGHFLVDMRVQIGRVSRVHSAQQLSFLLVKLAKLWIKDTLVDSYSTKEPIMLENLSDAASDLGVEEMLPEMVKVFQVDIIKLDVDHLAMDAVDRMEQVNLRDELDITMSEKPEANRHFSAQFEFIAAFFYTMNLEKLLLRPANHILQRIQENMSWLLF